MRNVDPLLKVRSLGKRFGGVQALSELDLDVQAGHVHGLIGPNGSGKSTALHILNGFLTPDSGSVAFGGRNIDGTKPHQRAELGIGRVFQTPAVFGELTVLENVLVGCHTLEPFGRSLFSILFRQRMVARSERILRARCDESLASVGLAERGRETAEKLSFGERKLLDLARALVFRPRLLLCDEPAAGLSAYSVGQLKKILEQLRTHGTTIVIAEHNMKLVLNLCDRITALNFGRKIAEGTPQTIRSDPGVVQAYLGRSAN
jgi:ABC-type branched-subunit amino acid transport system ATPase component